MSKRGRVLRDPHMGPGLLMVEGKQYPFLMEGLWRSEVPAKPGLVVNVDFDTQGNLNGITAVPQAQLDAEKAASVRTRPMVTSALFEGFEMGSRSFTRLAATGLLLASWLFLSAVSVHLPFFGKLDLTFWQILGYLNAGNIGQMSDLAGSPDSGVFGFLAILVLAGPLLPHVWRDRRAWLGGLLPLAFMVLVALWIDADLHDAFAQQTNVAHQSAPSSVFSAISMGFGTYVSASLAIYFAVLSAKQWMGSRRPGGTEVVRSQQMAA